VSGNHSSLLSDYAISYINTAGTITPVAVTVTASTDTKVFDGTTASHAAVTNITGLLSGDHLTGLTQSYNNSHVLGADGSTLLVNSSRAGVTGNVGSMLSDYAISYVTSTGTITPAPVTVTASGDTKVYDGTTASTRPVTNISGLVAGDTLTGLTQSYNSSQALGANGSILFVDGSGVGLRSGNGNALSDYAISYVTSSGTITQMPDPAPAPPFNVDEWRGARWAAHYMAYIYPRERLTVTQSPESLQMLQVALTGALPTEGPIQQPVAGPLTTLSCVQGGIRTPDGVDSMPVNDCAPRIRPNRGI
jgi:hypothetical protein